MGELVPMQAHNNVDAYRASTDAASMCREIVVATATNIQGKSYVTVEGWQAIAIAHGCTAGARDVERVEGGVRAVGEIRRMSDGVVISVAEGFVGEDEPTWYGGLSRGKTLPRRADYAIRAMAQTRAISRACRSAFAHVVVMMKANLSTTPAEEVPYGGFDDASRTATVTPVRSEPPIEQPPQRQTPPPLKGPIKTRRELKDAVNEVVREIHACDDPDQLETFLALPATKAVVDQVEDEHELWWKGDNADFLGLEKEIDHARKRVALTDDGSDGEWRNDILRAG